MIDSRPAEGQKAIRRRRLCPDCGHRFTTYERAESVLTVLKRDGRRQPFSAEKLRRGVAAALADRPVSAAEVDSLVDAIEAEARSRGPQVESDVLGRMVLEHLKSLDEVAYLRFASVYKGFAAAEDFERELAAFDQIER